MTEQHETADGASDSVLDQRGKSEAEGRVGPTAAVLHEAIEIEGEEELGRPALSIVFSGIAAGLTMGLSMVSEGILRARLPEADWAVLVSSFGYTIGFLFVTLGKQQLYTETTLTATLPALQSPRRFPIVLRFWAIVFVTNMIGALLFAWAATAPDVFDPEILETFSEMARESAEDGYTAGLMQGIAAGWIIALMVWLLPAAGSAKILVIIFATYVIAIADLTHVVAGAVEVGHGAIAGAVGWGDWVGYVSAALIGNTIGGAVLVAMLNHAQVTEEK